MVVVAVVAVVVAIVAVVAVVVVVVGGGVVLRIVWKTFLLYEISQVAIFCCYLQLATANDQSVC